MQSKSCFTLSNFKKEQRCFYFKPLWMTIFDRGEVGLRIISEAKLNWICWNIKKNFDYFTILNWIRNSPFHRHMLRCKNYSDDKKEQKLITKTRMKSFFKYCNQIKSNWKIGLKIADCISDQKHSQPTVGKEPMNASNEKKDQYKSIHYVHDVINFRGKRQPN